MGKLWDYFSGIAGGIFGLVIGCFFIVIHLAVPPLLPAPLLGIIVVVFSAIELVLCVLLLVIWFVQKAKGKKR